MPGEHHVPGARQVLVAEGGKGVWRFMGFHEGSVLLGVNWGTEQLDCNSFWFRGRANQITAIGH